MLSIDNIILPLDDDDKCRKNCAPIVRHCRPNWRDQQLEFEFFDGGITNRIFSCWPKCESGRDRLVFRVYGRNTELIINRAKEIETIKILTSSECAPPLEATFANGIVIGYLPGETLQLQSVREPKIAEMIAGSLAQFHRKIEISVSKAEIWQRLHSFTNNRPAAFKESNINKRYQKEYPSSVEIDNEIQRVAFAVERLKPTIVFCHNDLLIRNIIYDDISKKISFIDYEYAFPNYQAFDVANHFNEFAGVDELDFTLYPDRDFQLDWIARYLSCFYQRQVSNDEIIDFYDQVQIFAALSHLFWCCWALVQAANSSINFDFFQYSLDRWYEYLNFAQKYLN